MENGQKPRVAIGVPRADARVAAGTAHGYLRWPTMGACDVCPVEGQSSLLNHTFNNLWAGALNGRNPPWGFTHFAMLHSDIQPAAGWVDVLLQELERHNLDVISVVVPIKTPEGLTSTAVGTDDPWWRRRLTLKEVFDLPETFDLDALHHHGIPGGPLLINTGCWLARLDRPWCDATHPDGSLQMCFRTRERIIKLPSGDWAAQNIPEDWLFSHYLSQNGIRYAATRKVQLTHLGDVAYSNASVWGTKDTDTKFFNSAARLVSAQEESTHAEDYPVLA